MPWTVSDVDSKIGGLTDKQKRAWVHIANSSLRACKLRGGSDCDAEAIRKANSASKRINESIGLDTILDALDAVGPDRDATSLIEALLRLGDSHEELSNRINQALYARYSGTDLWHFVSNVFDDDVVYRLSDGRTYRCTYKDSDGVITLGEPLMVELAYSTVVESSTDFGSEELVQLTEAKFNKNGEVRVKVIAPGQGASAYYPADVLKRDGPKVFTEGTKMFWDHQTAAEEADRPEGSLRNLAGVFSEDAQWSDDPKHGPGLYTTAKVFEPYRAPVRELADLGGINISIRAAGLAKEGQVGGKPTKIVQSLKSARSVDFVTQAGAGGRVVQLFEAARSRQTTSEEVQMDEKELQALREAAAQADNLKLELGRAREALRVVTARQMATQVLEATPDVTAAMRARLIETVIRDVPVKDGEIDAAAFNAKVAEAAKAEVAYIAAMTNGARVVGQGDTSTKFSLEAHEKLLQESVDALLKGGQ